MATTQAPASALDQLLASIAQSGQNSATSRSGAGLNSQAGSAAEILLQSMRELSNPAAATAAAQATGTDLLRQIMPSIAGSARGAGLYNSTTQQQLTDNANAQITAAMSKVLLDQANTQQQLQTQAGSALGTLNQSTRTETAQKGQSVGDTLKTQLGSLLVTQGLGALRKGLSGSDILSSGLDAGYAGATLGDVSNLGSAWSSAGSLGSGLSGVTDFTAPAGGGLAEWLGGGNTISDTVSNVTGGLGGIVDGIGGAISDAWSGLGSWTGWWANGGRIPGADSTGGKDNMIIGVGGGEVVLPPDTVKALDAKLGEDWVQELIDATHTNVRPKPTAAAMAAKEAATK